MKEIWKDIFGYEGEYQISNLGRIKSLDRTIVLDTGRHFLVENKIIKQKTTSNGKYKHVRLRNKFFSVHRLVAIHFIKTTSQKLKINHIDNNGHNNRVENLEWCTQKENVGHAVKNGFFRSPTNRSDNPSSKLSLEDVVSILTEYKPFIITRKDLAKKYRVNKSTIDNIISGKSWGITID